MNICVFGDSVTKGVVYDEIKNKYVFLKDSFINLTQSDTGFAIRNFAKFGSTSVKGTEIMRKHEDDMSDYDYTLLEFGGNDCDFLWDEIAEAPEALHHSLVPPEQFRQQYMAMITKVRSSGSHPVLLTLPPLVAERFFTWISKGLNKDNILEFLGGDKEYIFRWHEQYNEIINEIAREQNVPVIDIRKAVLSAPDYESLVCIDGMHPNCRGHKVIAEYLEKALTSFVELGGPAAKTA